MKFSITVAAVALASGVIAAPGYNSETPQQPGTDPRFTCNSNMEISCCNQDNDSIGNNNGDDNGNLLSELLSPGGGLLNGLLGGPCTRLPIQIPVIGVAVQDLANQQCTGRFACCNQENVTTEGLVAVNACTPLSIL